MSIQTLRCMSVFGGVPFNGAHHGGPRDPIHSPCFMPKCWFSIHSRGGSFLLPLDQKSIDWSPLALLSGKTTSCERASLVSDKISCACVKSRDLLPCGPDQLPGTVGHLFCNKLCRIEFYPLPFLAPGTAAELFL